MPADHIPTYAYNWSVAPHTPMAVAGVVWVPNQANLSPDVADYAAELEAYAKSLPSTYGQDEVPFIYAQPAPSLVPGITQPKLPRAKAVVFDAWPASLEELAKSLAKEVE